MDIIRKYNVNYTKFELRIRKIKHLHHIYKNKRIEGIVYLLHQYFKYFIDDYFIQFLIYLSVSLTNFNTKTFFLTIILVCL